MAQHFITRAVLQAARGLPRYPNLDVVDLACGRGDKWEHSWVALAWPLVALGVMLETSRRLETPLHAAGERDLWRWMLHPAMLFSEQLLLVAHK
jgi:hypothetical protein